jgi:hypothetical protein
MEKYAAMDNISKEFPYTDVLTDKEVMKDIEAEIALRYPDYRNLVWKVEDVPMGFGRRFITCKFEVN